MAKDLDALAAQFGGSVMQDEAMPSGGGYGSIMDGLSPKDQAELRMKQYASGEKRISELGGEISNAAPTMSDLNRFMDLNKRTSTGSAWETVAPDWKMLHGNDINEMRKIQQRLAPNQRGAGAGSSSDTDVKMYLNSLPSADDRGGVNQAIIDDYSRRYNYAVAKKQYLDNYLQSRGSLNGADTEWMKSPQYKQFIGGVNPSSKQSVVSGGGWSAKAVK